MEGVRGSTQVRLCAIESELVRVEFAVQRVGSWSSAKRVRLSQWKRMRSKEESQRTSWESKHEK